MLKQKILKNSLRSNIHLFNKILVISTSIAFLTIYIGVLLEFVLAIYQVVITIELWIRKKQLSKEIVKHLRLYTGLALISLITIIAFPRLTHLPSPFLGIAIFLIFPMLLSFYNLHITNSVKKHYYESN